jgi:hypothetical protein
MSTGADEARAAHEQMTEQAMDGRFHSWGEDREVAIRKGKLHVRLTNKLRRDTLSTPTSGGEAGAS